jgi:DNA-binding Lrp family transcriptional regulator
LFRNPLPPAAEHAVFRDVRNDAGILQKEVLGPRFDELGQDVRRDFLQEFNDLAEQYNPIVRRVIRRTRPMLEERGLLKRIGVIVHPRADDGLPAALFDAQGLVMGLAFDAAYDAAESFSNSMLRAVPVPGF